MRKSAEVIREDGIRHYSGGECGRWMVLLTTDRKAIFEAEYLMKDKVLNCVWPAGIPADRFATVVERTLGHPLDWEQVANSLDGKVNKDVLAQGRFTIETKTHEGWVPRATRMLKIWAADKKSLEEVVGVAKSTVIAPALLPKRALRSHLNQFVESLHKI